MSSPIFVPADFAVVRCNGCGSVGKILHCAGTWGEWFRCSCGRIYQWGEDGIPYYVGDLRP